MVRHLINPSRFPELSPLHANMVMQYMAIVENEKRITAEREKGRNEFFLYVIASQLLLMMVSFVLIVSTMMGPTTPLQVTHQILMMHQSRFNGRAATDLP